MNNYLYFICFFICFFINCSKSVCVESFSDSHSSPGSSPRRPAFFPRNTSPIEKSLPMDVVKDSPRNPAKARALFGGQESQESIDVDLLELEVVDDGAPRAMQIQPDELSKFLVPIVSKRGIKRGGDKLESCSKRFFSDKGDVIGILHKPKKAWTYTMARSISTSPTRAPLPKLQCHFTP